MDSIRGEVSNKIRSAIKAKLMELGAYVDDELPDYIMVMVANKRSRQQMEEDLQLFLGDSTTAFTTWLHTVLSKLQQVTVNSTELKKGSEKKRVSSEDFKKENKKKLKKEKDKEKCDKVDKSPEKVKSKEEGLDKSVTVSNDSQFKSKSIKSEPIDLVADKASLPNKHDGDPSNSQPAMKNLPGIQQKKSSVPKPHDEEDDDDFINLKADVEADMWGDTDEPPSSAVRSLNVPQSGSPVNVTETRPTEPKSQEAEQSKHYQSKLEKTLTGTVPSEGVSTSTIAVSKTASMESKSTPRIIRISQTIREEQETLKKPASKVVRDPQKEERSPPSPIIFSSNSTHSTEKIEDDSDNFGRHIAQELRQLPFKLRKLAKLKIQQIVNECWDSDKLRNKNSKQQTTDVSKKKNSSKAKRLRDKSNERRHRRKKSLELSAEKGRQLPDRKPDWFRKRLGDTIQCHKKRNSFIKFGSLRMDFFSQNRSRSACSTNDGYCETSPLSVHDQSPTPPRSLGSVVTVALVKRVFQSHIVSNATSQSKEVKSHRRGSSSHTSENRTRRNDNRSSRKHEQQDLRETLRKERQEERDHDRNRERERRRSRDLSRSRKSQQSVSRDENIPDPALASVVRVKPRPQIPAALQANRSLILKAVAEAQRSVSKVVVRPELAGLKSPSKPQPNKKHVKERLQIHKQTNLMTTQFKRDLLLPSKQSARLPSREALKKMSFTVHAKEPAPSTETLNAELDDASDEGSFILDPSLNILIQVPASPAVEETIAPPNAVQAEKVQKWIKDVEEATKSEGVSSEINTNLVVEEDTFTCLETKSKQASNEDSEEFDDALDVDTTSLKTSDIHSVAISEDQPVKRSSGTQFVVTLDGLDPMLLRSFALESDTPIDIVNRQEIHHSQGEVKQGDKESLIRDELIKEQLLRQELLRQQAAVREQKAGHRPTVAVSPVATPVNPAVKRPASPGCPSESRPLKGGVKGAPVERCKFWPTCKNGDKCEFQHPAVPCKLFPNCKFSDRCLYLHPKCRFNTACTRADCSYMHTGARPTLTTAPSGGGSQSIKQACKYFPNCSNLSCPFIHPTVCKFGTHCTKPTCQFIHSDKTLMTKHKWVRH